MQSHRYSRFKSARNLIVYVTSVEHLDLLISNTYAKEHETLRHINNIS